ncbi:tetratricopeptide repeat protein [Candidatus Babeliales bacterium]|nr:tetratricopeptide repeat protein [Candidatus Babeliales bacterium]
MSRKKKNLSSKSVTYSSDSFIIKHSNNKLSFLQKIIPPSILAILTAIFYWPSLNYPFQFDDLANITKNFGIRFDIPWKSFFSSRWMSFWLNRVNYQFGEFNPFIYRLTNLIIHILTGLILFFLILELCRFLKTKPFFLNNALIIAFTTSALFLLHPVQTQTVSYVIQARMEGLATLFILATILFYVKIFKTQNIFLKIIFSMMAITSCLLSGGAKEIFVLLPFLILLVDWFFISEGRWENFKKRFIISILFFSIFTITILFFLGNWGIEMLKRIFTFSMQVSNNRGNILTKHAYDTITASSFLISQFKVVLHYLWMFIWPFNLSVEYDWKLSESFFSIDSFFPFLALISITFLAMFNTIKKKGSFFAFGIFWFLISIAPRSSIMPSPELICDYKTYLASVGWIFIIAVSLVYLIKLAIHNLKQIPTFLNSVNYQLSMISILMIGIGLGTLNRNTVWKSPENFWGDIVKKAPQKARGHNNYGVALSEAGKVDKAIKHYKKAISLDRYYADPLSNISVAYSMKGNIDKAISALKGAIIIFPNYAEAHNNLGTLLLKKKIYNEAEQCLNKAIKLRGHYGKAYYNLGRLYIEKKNEEKAWQYFKKATEGDLDNPQGFFTLAQMSMKLKKYDEAIKSFHQILRRGVNTPQIRFNLANAYFMINQIKKSRQIYNQLSQEYPLESKYIYNLAETYFSENKFSNALELFQKALSLPQPIAQSHFRITACLEKMNKTQEATEYLNKLLKVEAPDKFKQMVKNEIAKLKIQKKVTDGKGSMKFSELQNILKQTTPAQKTKTDKQS